MNFLGIDIGTSGCKAVVFDVAGRQVAAAQREYNVHFTPDGGAELDSTEVLDKCLAVITEAAQLAGRGTVTAVGISSQGEAFTAIDCAGRPLPEEEKANRDAGNNDNTIDNDKAPESDFDYDYEHEHENQSQISNLKSQIPHSALQEKTASFVARIDGWPRP